MRKRVRIFNDDNGKPMFMTKHVGGGPIVFNDGMVDKLNEKCLKTDNLQQE